MTLLGRTKLAFQNARSAIIDAIALLYQVREENAWEGQFGSFNEFLEEGCQMDKGQASRLLTAYEHFAINGRVELAQLRAVNPEKLYLASSLPGTPEEQLAKATTLSRSELNIERADKGGEHECAYIEICKFCHKRR